MKTRENTGTVVLVDGENVSAKRADEILRLARRFGQVDLLRVYHRQKDPITRAWTEKAKVSAYTDVCLFGGPEKNKIDRKIQKDAQRYFSAEHIGGVVVVSNDADFRCLAEDAAAAGKRFGVIGEKQAPARLRRACDRFVELPGHPV